MGIISSHGGRGVGGGVGAFFKRGILCGKTVEFFYREEAKERRSGKLLGKGAGGCWKTVKLCGKRDAAWGFLLFLFFMVEEFCG